MHPNLSAHLHGDECRKVIEALQKCHRDHPYKKFLGACNDFKIALDSCLYKEYKQQQKKNLEQSRLTKKRYQQMNKEDQ